LGATRSRIYAAHEYFAEPSVQIDS